MTIDATTGVITAAPSINGFFTFAIRVEEFRDLGSGTKVKIGETRRDIQYQSLNCPIFTIIPTVTTNLDTLTSDHPLFNPGGGNYQWLDCNNNYAIILSSYTLI